jgi:hypothetical protein
MQHFLESSQNLLEATMKKLWVRMRLAMALRGFVSEANKPAFTVTIFTGLGPRIDTGIYKNRY